MAQTQKKPKAKPYHEQVAEKLIQQLEQGTSPFQKPWKPGQQLLPYNALSGRRYRGANVLNLAMQGRADPRWVTYDQATKMGGQVRRGEKSTMVRYWQFEENVPRLDARGNPLIGPDGQVLTTTVPLEKPRAFSAFVFNGEQIDNMPPLPERATITEEWERNERAEKIIAASGATIKHVNGDRAMYHPGRDEIVLPERGQFETAERYYATALHELGHWTGHESRLNRNIRNPFGSSEYAKEELRAEIASLMTGNDLGTSHDPSQHVAYVKSWIQILRDDPMEIMRAAADAEKIMTMVMSFEQTQTQTEDITVQTPQGPTELTVADLTRDEHARMSEAEERYKRELQRVFGSSADDNWNATKHSQENVDPLLHEAAQEFLVAGDEWMAALQRASDKIGAVNLDAAALADGLKPDQVVAEMQAAAQEPVPERSYLAVPYAEKDEVKALGAKWDKTKKAWYVPPGMDTAVFAKWAVEKHDQAGPDAPHTSAQQVPAARPNDAAVSESDDLPHYSDQTLAALIADYGWRQTTASSVVRQFVGVGPDGMMAPHGERDLLAGYNADIERRRYIAVTLGDQIIADFDGREGSPQEIAAALNLAAANYADEQRVKRGHDPRYVEEARRAQGGVQAAQLTSQELAVAAGQNTQPDVNKLERGLFGDWDGHVQGLKERQVNAQKALDDWPKTEAALREKEGRDRQELSAAHDAGIVTDEMFAEQSAMLDGADYRQQLLDGLVEARDLAQEKLDEVIGHNTPDTAIAPRIYLAVPYVEKDAAKQAGAKWDKAEKAWYVPKGSELSKIERWLPENINVASSPTLDVEDEFLEALRSLGMEPGTDRRVTHPIMDGSRQRVPVVGDRAGERSGFYVAYMNEGGRPAGFIQNNRTGESVKWVSCGQELDQQQLAAQRALVAQKQAERDATLTRTYAEKAQKLSEQFSTYRPITQLTPYLLKKGVTVGILTNGLKTSKDGNATIIPAYDIDGKQWTTQYIQPDGTKLFAKDAKKEGCFFPIGGSLVDVATAPVIIICEGLATGTSIKKVAPNSAVLVAFDSKNLARVAQAVAEKFPNKATVLAADDDAHAVMTCGKNVGLESAKSIADETKAVVIAPIFSPAEKNWPTEVPAFTPEEWRSGGITDAQRAAFAQYKKLTDFNDMDQDGIYGLDGVQRQIQQAVLTAQKEVGRRAEQNASQNHQQDQQKVRAANKNDGYQGEQIEARTQKRTGKARTR